MSQAHVPHIGPLEEEQRRAGSSSPGGQGSLRVELDVHRGPGWRPVHVLLMVAAAGIAFQVFHFAEHVLQAGYWVLHPAAPPWLTPWGEVGRRALANATDGQAGTGNELLHLLGNAVLLLGLVAGLAAIRAARSGAHPRWLRRATWVQGAHLAEHAVLTATWVVGGRALGVTNLFGVVDAGSVAGGSTRVWAHFAVNLVVTAMAVRGLAELRAAGLLPKIPRHQRKGQRA